MWTVAPQDWSEETMAAPMPWEPPVTTAILPVRSMRILLI